MKSLNPCSEGERRAINFNNQHLTISVLILVLKEKGGPYIKRTYYTIGNGLNPCSEGERRARLPCEHPRLQGCLNPCSEGERRAIREERYLRVDGCLNPCSEGERRALLIINPLI